VDFLKFRVVNRILWPALGVSFTLISAVYLLWPLVAAENGSILFLVIAGIITAGVCIFAGRLVAVRFKSAYISNSPDNAYTGMGVAMCYGAIGGMALGAVVFVFLFGQAMFFELIEPTVTFWDMIINSIILGASYGVMLGLMTGFLIGAAAAYQIHNGEDLTSDLTNRVN